MSGPDEPREPEGYDDAPPFRPARRSPLLHRTVPVAREVPHYGLATVRLDLVAALTVAALAVPSAMAYAELAGLPPVAGLYALLLPTVAYALLGSSRQIIIGPEGSISALVAVSVLASAAAGSPEAGELAALLALLVGACFVVARVVRVGWLADYLSRPVLMGYIHGVAIVLIVGHLEKLLGVDVEALDPFPQLVEVVSELGEAHAATVAVGLAALALVALKRLMPGVPAALVVVVCAIAASAGFDLAANDVAVVGTIPSGLPGLHVPAVPAEDVVKLLPAAIGIFLVCFADEVLTARSFRGQARPAHRRRPRAAGDGRGAGGRRH